MSLRNGLDEASLEFFTASLNESLNSLSQQRESGSEFNVFALVGIDEMRLSRVLGGLLDPSGRHDQGDRFLRCFLDAVGLTDFESKGKVNVRLEATTSDQRRMDILIESDRWLVGIENKPWAGDQDRQIHDYVKDLKSRCLGRPFKLVFWSDRDPTTQSVGSALHLDEWRQLTYRETIDAFRKSTQISPVISSQVGVPLEQWLQWLEWKFYGKGPANMQTQQIVDFIISDPQRLQTCLAVGDALDTIKNQVQNQFLTELEKQLRCTYEMHGGTVSRYGICPPMPVARYAWLGLRNKDCPDIEIALSFDQERCRQAGIGIRKFTEKPQSKPAYQGSLTCGENFTLQQALQNHLGRGRFWPHWEWEESLPKGEQDWFQASTLLDISSNKDRWIMNLLRRFDELWTALEKVNAKSFKLPGTANPGSAKVMLIESE
jgi:hypothetical protein